MKSKVFNHLPTHVAFIMDGNGRWASKRGLSRQVGHVNGVKTLVKIVNEVFSIGIPYVTVFAFSTENWSRPKEEVDTLMNLIREYFSTYFADFKKQGIKVNLLGDVSAFDEDIRDIINSVVSDSPTEIVGTINVALNYGGRSEIVRAVNKAVERGERVTEESFNSLLYTQGIPDPDLIVRTSGEERLSNFLLYQAAYSELVFCKTLWPDFDKRDLYKVLSIYSKRNRRYGKV